MKKFISSIKIIRILFLPFLNFFNFEFKWKHDITKRDFFLESFKHKGYWYYGRSIENYEINSFYKLIKSGDNVLEVGSNIGYLTQVFEQIVGHSGQVLVIEPTPESIFYLKKNVYPSTKIITKAASNFSGKGKFYMTNFGGFTNSLDKDYTKFKNEEHQKTNNISSHTNSITVDIDTLDNICRKENFHPTFLKIDVEGSELNVLKGALNLLNSINGLMVEISSNKEEICELLKSYGFKICFEEEKSLNYFFKKS